jgi:hypothetical protein
MIVSTSTKPIVDVSFQIEGVHWTSVVGRVVVLQDSTGKRIAIAKVGGTKTMMGLATSLRLPPFLALVSWSPAVCQEDYSPAKGCAASSTPDSCGISKELSISSCRTASRHRFCDKQASLVLKVTREVNSCVELVIDVKMHNPLQPQSDAKVVVGGYGPGVSIASTVAVDNVLTAAEAPQFKQLSVTELGNKRQHRLRTQAFLLNIFE